MGIQFTKDQQKVIDLRNRSILVSAAAGSGKTAVLVERILSRIVDPKHPIDIDRMLIMTFTRAAAGEMKERIAGALEAALQKEPENTHLQRQMTLVHAAQITTIDGFCAYIVRNYFHLIDLDPGFRVADEGEIKLLREDLVRDYLTEVYERADPEFLHFVECYGTGKDDRAILELILELQDRAVSHPDPEEWLKRSLENYEVDEEGKFVQSKWLDGMFEDILQQLREAQFLLEKAAEACKVPGGPYHYRDVLEADLNLNEKLLLTAEKREYAPLAEVFLGIAFQALPRKKLPEDVSAEQKDAVVKLRNAWKKKIQEEIQKKYFSDSWENLVETSREAVRPLRVLISLTLEFMELFSAKKRERNLLDFSDLEHKALEILKKDAPEGKKAGPVALELQKKYEEVMVDEYQDSSQVQEELTQLVSRQEPDRKNLFMVGDVKQSIYRFRQARPDLFIEKYHRFTKEESSEQKVDLHKNFRSRKEVLGSVNYLFRQIMGEDLGRIAYDEEASLHCGAAYPEAEKSSDVMTELLIVDRKGDEEKGEQNLASEEALRREALACALKIEDLVRNGKVTEGKEQQTRPVTYNDIAILLRSKANTVEQFTEVLTSRGIPVFTAQRTGYFTTVEVQTVLNYLRILDNPLQDIPLAGVLRSPIGGFSAQDFAVVRAENPEGKLYESLRAFLEEGQLSLFEKETEKEGLKKKVRGFLADFADLREKVSYLPVSQLILTVLRVTGYEKIARALPDGEQRCANLAMLVEKAKEFEKTSYRGLFNFIRYMEQLKQYEVDFGEVNLSGAGEGAVRIMTIHMSKGLEFPIVLAAGLGKGFNLTDVRKPILVDPELGIGADAIVPEKRLKVPSLQKKMIARKARLENLGEEMRVLYVALTRAKEKLVMLGSTSDLEKKLREYSDAVFREEELLAYRYRSGAASYLDWILAALAGHPAMRPLMEEKISFWNENPRLQDPEAQFEIRVLNAEDLTEETMSAAIEEELSREKIFGWDAERTYDKKAREEIEKRFSFRYPREGLDEIPVKVTVSDLKKHPASEAEETAEAEDLLAIKEPKEEEGGYVPKFIRHSEEEQVRGAARGTAYHRVMECLEYDRTDAAELRAQLEEMVQSEKLTQEQRDAVRISDLEDFLKTELGRRMKQAGREGRLIREQPFMIASPARELREEWESEEDVLVQGIIDAYFVEGNDLVLVDYKTDRVNPGEEKTLLDRYHIQLVLYREALERITGRRVKETYLYSFALKKEISVL